MAAQGRTPRQKSADTITVYEEFRDQLTGPVKRQVLNDMTGAMQQAAASVGDVQAYAALVQASLTLDRVISANDRAALLAAAIVTQSGVVRVPQLEVVSDEE